MPEIGIIGNGLLRHFLDHVSRPSLIFIISIEHNRSFTAGGHMVQNPKYWRAKECARLQNKTHLIRKLRHFFVFISQWSLVTFFCSPIIWILYHVTSSCKGPILQHRFRRHVQTNFDFKYFFYQSMEFFK